MFITRSSHIALFCVAAFICFRVADAVAQYESFAVENVGLSLGLSDTSGRWSYYTLSLSSWADGKITGAGVRSDIHSGPDNVSPANTTNVSVSDNAKLDGILSYTNRTTFDFKLGKKLLILTNEVISDAAFLAIPLSDGGLLKGAFVHNHSRKQTAKSSKNGVVYGWKTNHHSWFSGQLFGSFDGMSGSTLLGDQ